MMESEKIQRRLVLASASPRRADLLRQVGLPFEAHPSGADETRLDDEPPERYVVRLAEAKAREVLAAHPDALVIGADTIVVLDGQVLGKPRGEQEAIDMLLSLSDRTHQVLTGLAVLSADQTRSACVRAEVDFVAVSEATARRYWRTGDPADKAGGYGVQSQGGVFVRAVRGSYSAVVGLPLDVLEQMLLAYGYDTWGARCGER